MDILWYILIWRIAFQVFLVDHHIAWWEVKLEHCGCFSLTLLIPVEGLHMLRQHSKTDFKISVPEFCFSFNFRNNSERNLSSGCVDFEKKEILWTKS